jgi:transcriptional regulator of acetoin/glycerol metabolism
LRELGCPRPRLTQAGIQALLGYDWPGNIRELRSVIERAVIFARGGALDFEDRGDLEYLTDAEMQRLERENLFASSTTTSERIFEHPRFRSGRFSTFRNSQHVLAAIS